MDKNKIDSYLKLLPAEINKTDNALESEEQLLRLSDVMKAYNGEDKVISFESIAEQIKLEVPEEQMMTGHPSIDNLLKGFRKQQLIVLSAVTGNGKTSFCMDLSERLADYNPLWFPFEESAYELVRKCIERGVTPPRAYTPKSLEENKLEWMEMKMIEAKVKFNSQVVFIDHLEYIVPKGFDEVQETSKIMRELKGIAKKLNIVIVLLCHLKKVKIDTQPTTEDVKGSTSISQQADTIFLLWRETKREDGKVVTTSNVNVSIQKNRRFGQTGNIKMVFDNGRFIEQDWSTDAEQASNELKNF